MRITLLGVLGFIAVAALLGYMLYEFQQKSQKNEPPQPSPNPNPNRPPENL